MSYYFSRYSVICILPKSGFNTVFSLLVHTKTLLHIHLSSPHRHYLIKGIIISCIIVLGLLDLSDKGLCKSLSRVKQYEAATTMA